MKTLRDLKGMPVLSLQEGERLGQVRDLIVDPVAGQVVALVLDQRTSEREHLVVATANIHSIGDAAITVEDRSRVVPLSRIPRFKELAQAGKPIRGKMALTESGSKLGHIGDLEIDPQTFRIVSFLLKGFLRRGQALSAERVRTVGTDVVVVRDEPAPGVVAVQPAPIPTVAAPPVEVPEEPREPEPDVGPEPVPSLEAEPEPVLESEWEALPPLDEEAPAPTEEGFTVEAEPAVPAVSVLPEVPPSPPAEPSPPATEAEPAPPWEEVAPPAGLVEPPTEGATEEPAENPWQRWVRRLRRREED